MSNTEENTTSQATVSPSFRWYVVHTYSGSEKKVRDEILKDSERLGLSHHIDKITIPVIEVKEVRRGVEITVDKNFMPSYILAHLSMTDSIWQLIKSTPKVTGFLGSDKAPVPISDTEVMRLFEQMEIKEKKVSQSTKYAIGDSLKIIDGPFDSFSGIVEEVDELGSKVKVAVTIFGRVTPIELNFSQIQKNDSRGK